MYYYKDDVTEFSKGLKLNKLKKGGRGKRARGTRSDAEKGSLRSMRSISSSGGSESPYSTGSSWMSGRHQRMQKAYSQDAINASHLVDDWNKRYIRLKDKQVRAARNKKKKKISEKQKTKIAVLGEIYGQDARTLAGFNSIGAQSMISGIGTGPADLTKRTALGRSRAHKRTGSSPGLHTRRSAASSSTRFDFNAKTTIDRRNLALPTGSSVKRKRKPPRRRRDAGEGDMGALPGSVPRGNLSRDASLFSGSPSP